jgi:hypothetical protein
MPNKWNARYVPITHEYAVEDDKGDLVASVRARPGTDADQRAARLIAAAPDLFAALWLLLGDEETAQTAVMDSEDKQAIARQALKRAALDGTADRVLRMSKWYEPDD